MTAICQVTLSHPVAVRQQERITRFIGDDAGCETGQHVWAIQIEGDMAEAFGLALGAQRFARQV
ncbi:hypothetical protein D3C71_2009470 [compost metagenome]